MQHFQWLSSFTSGPACEKTDLKVMMMMEVMLLYIVVVTSTIHTVHLPATVTDTANIIYSHSTCIHKSHKHCSCHEITSKGD